MTSSSGQKSSANQCAFDIQYQITKNSAIPCTSLSLVRAITFISEYQSQNSHFFSNLHLAAAALSISIQLNEPRFYTSDIVEVISILTKFELEPLNFLRRSMIEEINMEPTDMVYYYKRDLMLSAERTGLDQKQFLSQALAVTIAMLVGMGKDCKDSRENLIPQIKAFIQECSDASNVGYSTIRGGLQNHFGEPAQLLPVFLRYGDEDFQSTSIYTGGNLKTMYINLNGDRTRD